MQLTSVSYILLGCLDDIFAKYVQNRVEAAHEMSAQVIGGLVREKIAAAT
jgi:hypothetical protein